MATNDSRKSGKARLPATPNFLVEGSFLFGRSDSGARAAGRSDWRVKSEMNHSFRKKTLIGQQNLR